MKNHLIIPIIIIFLTGCGGFPGEYREKLADYKKPYFLYAEKKTNTMWLVNSEFKKIKKYIIATGEKEGDKLYRGDFRTPSGIYKITSIYSYDKPLYLKKKEKELKALKKNTAEYKKVLSQYNNLMEEYRHGREMMRGLNSLYLSAEEGHYKYGTKEALGKNAYGPVFMRVSYPEEKDIEIYEKAKKKGEIPPGKNGKYPGPGGSIAIHGTNDPPSLGHNASAGCIRMHNDEIRGLLDYVEKGTVVIIK